MGGFAFEALENMNLLEDHLKSSLGNNFSFNISHKKDMIVVFVGANCFVLRTFLEKNNVESSLSKNGMHIVSATCKTRTQLLNFIGYSSDLIRKNKEPKGFFWRARLSMKLPTFKFKKDVFEKNQNFVLVVNSAEDTLEKDNIAKDMTKMHNDALSSIKADKKIVFSNNIENEIVNAENFLYDKIGDSEGKIIILSPIGNYKNSQIEHSLSSKSKNPNIKRFLVTLPLYKQFRSEHDYFITTKNEIGDEWFNLRDQQWFEANPDSQSFNKVVNKIIDLA